MGFVSDMLSGGKGSGFQATGVDPAQLNTAYSNTQSGIKQQQDFVNALQGQNGLANQSNVFNQQQGLANQLQGVANGTGPNPALAQLNQTTGNNIAAQNAMMAGQRGAAQNVGLMARQAAMQGANTQQQAVGQGATMQAQQQLAGMQQLGAQQANMANMANGQVNQQATGIQNLNQNSLQQQSNLMGLQSNINSSNAGIAQGNQTAQQNIMGGLMQGAGAAAMMLADGGEVGAIDVTAQTPVSGTVQVTPGPMSKVGKAFAEGYNKTKDATPKTQPAMAQGVSDLMEGIASNFAHGGQVPALVSPGEVRIHAKDVPKVAKGEKSPMSGEKIPGKAKVAGAKNSYANDTVPKTLNEGDIIIPRSISQGKDAEKKAHAFVSAILAKKGQMPKRSK